jgi:hypothetical protein
MVVKRQPWYMELDGGSPRLVERMTKECRAAWDKYESHWLGGLGGGRCDGGACLHRGLGVCARSARR